jgi:hypothetical protein
MTRKDYVKFAELVRVAKHRYNPAGTKLDDACLHVVDFFETEMADLFARDNARFDRQRFAIACKREADTTYKIVRFYHPSLDKPSEVIEVGLSLEEAQEHCEDPETRKEGEYFDGYSAE